MARQETNPGITELQKSMEFVDGSALSSFAKDAIKKAVESVDPDMVYAWWLTDSIQKNVDDPAVKMTPEMLAAYEEVFTNPKEYQFSELPEHKIQWYMQAADLVWQATGLTEAQPLSKNVLRQVARNFGLFEAEYVDPKVEAEYRASANWESEKGYGDSLDYWYVGDRRIEELATKHNRFDEKDFDLAVGLMIRVGHLQTVFGGGLWPDYTRPIPPKTE